MPKAIVVVGCQWGDEGKGKIVDLLTKNVAAVIRFQGGNNAGHTLVLGGKKTILRLIPSGILHPGVKCLIANGVVISLSALFSEIQAIEKSGIPVYDQLRISASCPIVLPSHVALDKACEQKAGTATIGTTKLGIGPAYEDKVARRGLRMSDLLETKLLPDKLKKLLSYHNFLLENYYHTESVSYEKTLEELLTLGEKLIPLVADIPTLLAQYQNKFLLFEGAQGTFLDIDHGTYPYVTSSNTIAAAAATGSGFGVRNLNYVLGISKAYSTRVGQGPHPTELFDDTGMLLRQHGREYGTVTKRERRCGWLDAVLLRRSVQLNSISALAITKLDVLDNLNTIKICTAYRYQHKILETFPLHVEQLSECEPLYEELPGWQTETSKIRNFSDLPANAKDYLRRIEELTNTPVHIISVGPDREETIIQENLFE